MNESPLPPEPPRSRKRGRTRRVLSSIARLRKNMMACRCPCMPSAGDTSKRRYRDGTAGGWVADTTGTETGCPCRNPPARGDWRSCHTMRTRTMTHAAPAPSRLRALFIHDERVCFAESLIRLCAMTPRPAAFRRERSESRFESRLGLPSLSGDQPPLRSGELRLHHSFVKPVREPLRRGAALSAEAMERRPDPVSLTSRGHRDLGLSGISVTLQAGCRQG